MLTLTQEGNGPGQQKYNLSGHKISIGRMEGNHVVLPETHISSRHAAIHVRAGQYIFSDLGSTNGSAVQRQGERLLLGPKGQPELVLRSGDLLLLGDIDKPVRLRVSISRAEAGGGAQNTVVATRARSCTAELDLKLASDHQALQALYRMVRSLNAQGDQEAVPSEVARAVLDAIPEAVDVLLVLRQEGVLQVKAAAHQGQGLCNEPNSKICEQVLGGDAALLFGQHDASVLPAHTLVSQGLGSGIAAPLWMDQRVQGVLQINCAPGRFDLNESLLDLAVVLAHHAAAALEKADLLQRLQVAHKRLRAENTLLRRQAQPEVALVAEDPRMKQAVAEIERAATSDVTVLIQGETGTGKELAARYLHACSARRAGLMVPVNCGALSETLLDSELFGFRKGAFTGASADRKGVFAVAEGGTVFLDEIGETPSSLQVRLLRVLEEGKIKVLGEAMERPVNVRIIAASNRDLKTLVQEGRFRQDLYYRLRVFPIDLPPLRERPADIEPLCRLFIARFSTQMGKQPTELDPGLIQALEGYPFPGNVRELANEMERAVVRLDADQPLTADLLSEEVRAASRGTKRSGPLSLKEQLAQVERRLIREALVRNNGLKTQTAQELGITRQGLAKKMERLGLC